MKEEKGRFSRREVLVFVLGAMAGVTTTSAGFLTAPVWSNGDAAQPVLVRRIDIGYAQSMIQHHNQALVMSSLIEAQASEPVARLARSIIKAQTSEIEQLKGWLIALEAPMIPADGDWMGWMREVASLLNINERLYLARCDNDPNGMEGLASPSQIKQLADQSTPIEAREQLFLQLMIKHHQGAVEMSTLPARHAATRYMRHLASHVVESQSREMALMKGLLARS